MISIAKQEIRAKMLAMLKNLPDEVKDLAAQEMLRKITTHPKYLEARQISLFISMSHEINTRDLVDISLQQGKRVFAPKIGGKNMRMLEIQNSEEIDSFPRTKWGIPEPPADRSELPAEQLSKTLFVVPALAFNSDGMRLGYGGGYYDKFLTQLAAQINVDERRTLGMFFTIGVGFKCQLIQAALPTNSADFCLHEVITS